jgi:hypothetical protein
MCSANALIAIQEDVDIVGSFPGENFRRISAGLIRALESVQFAREMKARRLAHENLVDLLNSIEAQCQSSPANSPNFSISHLSILLTEDQEDDTKDLNSNGSTDSIPSTTTSSSNEEILPSEETFSPPTTVTFKLSQLKLQMSEDEEN